MNLQQKYTPRCLADIVGQAHVIRHLRLLVTEPHPCCLLFRGEPGTGKSATAEALAHDLGCYTDKWWQTVYTVCAADFTVDAVRHWFGPETPFRFRAPGGWHVLVLEELEDLSKECQRKCKDVFQRQLAQMHVIVVATSNTGGVKLDEALLERFRRFAFSSGADFAEACQNEIAGRWQAETDGLSLPATWKCWGWNDGRLRFSMRLAMMAMQEALDTAAVAA